MEEEDFIKIRDQALQIQEKKQTLLAGGVCCFFLFLTSLIWLILFSDLSNRNENVMQIVMALPTVEVLHQKYSDLFMKFDQNKMLLDNTKKLY